MPDRQLSSPLVDGSSALEQSATPVSLPNASAQAKPISVYASLPRDHWLREFTQIKDEILMDRVSVSSRGQQLMLSPSDNAGLAAKIHQLRDRHLETIAESIIQELQDRPGVNVEGTLTVQRQQPNYYSMSGLNVTIENGKGMGEPLALGVHFEVEAEERGYFSMRVTDPEFPGEIRRDQRWDDNDTPAAIARDVADEIQGMPERRKDYLDD